MRRSSLLIVSLAVICLLVAGVFGRLMVEPAGLLVDPLRPSIDEHVPVEERAWGNDLTRLFLPHHQRVGQALQSTGRVPKWDPVGFGGRPLVGNPQSGIWYPPVWTCWIWFAPAALGWLTVGHLVLAGTGALALAEMQGLGHFAALVAAGAFAVSPQLLGHTYEGHYPHIWAVCWYPWVFAAMLLWLKKGRRWAWAVVPPLALCLLSGHPQEGYFLVLTLGIWVLAIVAGDLRAGQRHRALTRILTWSAILALVLGMSAVDWLPALSLKEWVLARTDLSIRDASRYHVSPLNALQLLSPRALGGPADYFGRDNYWETQLAVGWTVLLLGSLAIFQTRGSENRLVRGWVWLAIVSLLFAMGRNLGVFPLFFSLVPGMDRFRVPARSLFLTSLAATQLAGHGIESLRTLDQVAWRQLSRRYARLVGILALLVAIGGVCRLWLVEGVSQDHDTLERLLRACSRLAANPVPWLSMLGAGLLFFLGGARVTRLRPSAAVTGLGSLALAELVIEGFLLVQVAPPARFQARDRVADALHRRASDGPPRIRARDSFYTDKLTVDAGIEKTNLNDYFQLQHAAILYERLYPMFDKEGRGRPRALAAEQGLPGPLLRQAVLDRMSVEFVVTDRPPSPSETAGLQLVEQVSLDGQPALIYRNPTALPRAYVVPQAIRVADPSLYRGFLDVPARGAVLMSESPIDPKGPGQPFTPALYTRPSPDQVVVQVHIERPGLLVVTDTWMPGWKAEVDGRPGSILKGNGSQRVIPLHSPGRHRVEMWYEPPGLAAASVAFFASLALLMAWAGASCLVVGRSATASQIHPLRLRSHHSAESRITKIRKNGQLSHNRTSF